MKIYGYSKSFGQGDHDKVKKLVVLDLKLNPKNIEVRFDGY